MIILEVGKSYVFKDVESCIEYAGVNTNNVDLMQAHYRSFAGFKIEEVNEHGNGFIGGDHVIDSDEIKFFKERESSVLRSELKAK